MFSLTAVLSASLFVSRSSANQLSMANGAFFGIYLMMTVITIAIFPNTFSTIEIFALISNSHFTFHGLIAQVVHMAFLNTYIVIMNLYALS